MGEHNTALGDMSPAGVSRCFIIAEIGVNHNGKIDLALRSLEAAAAAGADAVKFQTFSTSKLVRIGTRTAEYQQVNSGESDQYKMLRELELSPNDYIRLIDHCRSLGSIEFMSSPFDEESADYLIALGMRRIKIASGEITNLPFIAHLAGKKLPILLSTGMSRLEEVSEAVAVIKEQWRDQQSSMMSYLTLLHCTSNYPTIPDDVNLRAMLTLREYFGVAVGYSDHTVQDAVPLAAVAMGASVIEKHFTLDRNLPGPDHKASIEPPRFARMVSQIRLLERCLGDGRKEPRLSELTVRNLVRRSIVAARDIPPGHIIVRSDLVLLRPADGLPPRDLPAVIGKKAVVKIPAGMPLGWHHFSV